MDNTKKFNQNKIIDRIELELLSALFNYAAPFIDKKINLKLTQKNNKENNLETLIQNSKPKIAFDDIKELENLLLNNLNENIKVRKNIRINSNNLFYSLNLRRKKSESETKNKYSISIKYEENQAEEKLKLTIKNDGKEVYSAETTDNKEIKDRVVPYKVTIAYEDNYAEERLMITYKQQIRHYLQKHIQDREDMTNRVPLKWLNILPETLMGGVLGFTYLGENFMGRRADLTGQTARMVDIHESIHTPDEYETRCLTRWIMSKEKSKYMK